MISRRAYAQEIKSLRVGIANQLPYAFFEDGKLIGQSPEVLRAALRGTSVENIEGVVSEFSSLIPSLLANRIDVVCTGLFVRPERCKVVAFGNPDSMSRAGLLVQAGNPHGVTGLDDIKNKGLRLSFIRGSVEEAHLREAGFPESQWLILPDVSTLIAAVKAGRTDVGFLSLVMLGGALQRMNEPAVEMIQNFKPAAGANRPRVDYCAMGFRPADNALREMYNAGLAKIVASGELAEINAKWGLPKALSPTTETPLIDALCTG